MRVVVTLVLAFLTGLEAIGRVIQCSPRLFCNDQALSDWKRIREDAQQLVGLRHSSHPLVIKKNSSLYELMELKGQLCLDTSITAFLLTNETMDETRLSCIWPGNELSLTCSPVPQKYTTQKFHYIPPMETAKMIAEFRKKIHCSKNMEGAELPRNQVTEIYVCNERCTQAGIGYLASCLMMIAFSVSLIQNCFTAPA